MLKRIKLAINPSLMLALILVSPLSVAQVYKWTDENGQIHYSDKKPDSESNVESLKVKAGKSRSLSSKKEETSEKELQKKADELQGKTTEKDYTKECESITDNLNKLNASSRIRINDGGEMRYLTPEELDEKKAQYQKMFDDFCVK